MDIGKWALDNRKLIYFFIAAFIGGGILSYTGMSKLEDPEIKVKQALIVTTYPGASPHEVELEVTDILEKSIRSMSNIDHVESRSMSDLSMITVELSTLVPDNEVEQYWDLLRRKVNDTQHLLPQGASPSIVKDDFGDMFGMFYAITADGFSDREIGEYAQLAKRKIQNIEGVSKVEIYGEKQECINISLYQDKMAYLGVHPAEVLSTLSGQNKTIYSGYYETGDMRLRVSVNDRYRSVDDIANLLLQGHEGDQLRLKDIASISKGYESPVRNELMYDGQKALGFSVSARSGTDVTQLGEKVETVLQELQQERIPAGITFNKVFFQPDRVNDALQTFMINLVMSAVIVIGTLIFIIGFKSSLIIALSLVITVFGSIFILNLMDGTLQRVSLASFILAMALLVDNAIVIIDGILLDLKRGKSRREAMTSIGRKTAWPLLGATLIAILSFLPIFLSPDTAGVYVRDLFIVLAVSLLLSWLLALTQIPIQADQTLHIEPDKGDEKHLFDNKYYNCLRRVLRWGLGHKTTSIVAALLLVFGSAFCYRFLPQGFFPDMNYDQLYIEYKLPEGTNSNRVKTDLMKISDELLQREDIKHVTASVGGTPSRYNLVRSIADPSLSYGELIVDFTSPKALVSSIEELQEKLSREYPDAYVRLKRYNLMYKKFPIEVQFNGPDPAVLKELAAHAQEIMENDPNTFLVTSNWEPKVPVFMVDYNQPIARNVGLSREDIGLSLLSSTGGIPTGKFYDGIHGETIYLKTVDKDGKPIENLDNTSVFSLIPSLNALNRETLQRLMTGSLSEEDLIASILKTVPLSQASNGIRFKWEDPVVVRYNGERAIRAQCNPIYGVGAEKARQSIAKEIEAIQLPEGYTMQWEGENKASEQAMKYLFKNFPLAIILILGLLIMLFKDYKKPLIILCCIPLIFTGVILSMLVSGKTFGFVAIVGVLGLIGMMVKNGIVLMDEINEQLAAGIAPVEALIESTVIRFRPVLLVSLTTILGMIPLLSDDMFGSMAVTIMGGLLVGTLITLFFIPILFAVFFKIKLK